MRISLLLASLLTFALVTPASANEALASKSGCLACHAKDRKVLGPAYRDIAVKYKDQKDADSRLFEKVRKGGAGVWGPIPMAPNPPEKVSDADLKTLIDWILKGAL